MRYRRSIPYALSKNLGRCSVYTPRLSSRISSFSLNHCSLRQSHSHSHSASHGVAEGWDWNNVFERAGGISKLALSHSASIGFPLRMGKSLYLRKCFGTRCRRITMACHTPGSVRRKERPPRLSFLAHSTRGYCCLTTAVVSCNMKVSFLLRIMPIEVISLSLTLTSPMPPAVVSINIE